MLAEAIEQFHKTLQKDMGDRSGTVGGSEIGLCARQVFWTKNINTAKGVPPDDDYKNDFGAMIRGTVMEDAFLAPAMRQKYGANLLYAGAEQQKFRKGHLSATPDGLLINQPYDVLRHLGIKDIKSDCFMIDFKTIDPRANLFEAKEQHVYQINTQLGLIREFTPHKPQYGLLSYCDASFWSEVNEYPILFNPTLYAAAQARATEIITAKSGQQLAPEGYITGGKECSFCPFTKACGVERRGVPYGSKKASPQFAAEIEDMAREYNTIKTTIDKYEIKRKTLELAIKDRLRAKGVRRIANIVTWSEVKAPMRYNNKEIREEFKALGGDPDEFMSLGEPSDRLMIAASPAAVAPVKRQLPGKAKRPTALSNAKRKANVKKVSSKRRP